MSGEPLIEVAIETKDAGALAAVEAHGPMRRDAESGQWLLGGRDEEAIAQTLARLRAAGVEFRAGPPLVVYREVLAREETVRHTHKRALGGTGEFADVTLAFAPGAPGSGFVFVDATRGTLPPALAEGARAGIERQRQAGLLAGCAVTDFTATLIDARYHEIDSTARLFDTAAGAAFRELPRDAIALLEPAMRVTVTTPEDFLGGVIGDLNARRAMVLTSGAGTEAPAVLVAEGPLSGLLGYRAALAALTRETGACTMEFARFAPVPRAPGGEDPRFPGAAALRAISGSGNVIRFRR
jgi:elongation factor G